MERQNEMRTRFSSHKFALGLLALLVLILAACAPNAAVPQTGLEPTKPAGTPAPVGVFPGLDPEEILLQLDYEPGFTMQEFHYAFGRTPNFTLLADGRVIYVDESQDYRVMQAQLSQEEAAALLEKVLEMGFAQLESHTDMCGLMADGSEACIADASTTLMRVRMEDGSLREIRNYANFSNGPATYDAIYSLLNDYTHPMAAIYVPHGATLFVRIAPPPEMASPADWPLDPAYVARAQAAPEQFTAVALSAEEAAKWQAEVAINGMPITLQLEGQAISAVFAPWLPGQDFAADIAAEFPAQE
jgi:hypothetical protein